MTAPARMAIVTAYDPHAREWCDAHVRVLRACLLEVACDAFGLKYSHPLYVEMIITPGGVYFRPSGSDENFREALRIGPTTLEVKQQVNHERL